VQQQATTNDQNPPLDPVIRDLADGPHFAALTTLMPDGTPQTQVVWVGRDGDLLTVNSEVARQKVRNLRRDPRATLMIWEKDNPLIYVEVRGRVVEEVLGAAAREHIDQICLKYTGVPYPEEDIESDRVILRIRADRQLVRGRDMWLART
jgi:PPOX class probable F420-dependent enzyme